MVIDQSQATEIIKLLKDIYDILVVIKYILGVTFVGGLLGVAIVLIKKSFWDVLWAYLN